MSVLANIPFVELDAEMSWDQYRSTEPIVLMVASFSSVPHERSLDQFLNECWGMVRLRCPEAVLRVVGNGITNEMRNRWSGFGGVEVVGFVESLAEEYAGARLAICPLNDGGGSSIKVLEALIYGRTVVCSKFGARGLTNILKSGESLLVADSPSELAEACVALLNNPSLADALAARGRSLVRRHFTYQGFRREVRHAVLNAMRTRHLRGSEGGNPRLAFSGHNGADGG
jgi:glycosyltransferase involved in cell wall biosynthesis